MPANPFFEASPLILNYPQFDLIQTDHYLPAFERGMAEQLAEVEAIASQGEGPDFENTIIALGTVRSVARPGVPGIFQHEQRAYQ